MVKFDALDALEARMTLIEQKLEAAGEEKSTGKLKRELRSLTIIKTLISTYCPEEFSLGKLDDDFIQMCEMKKGGGTRIEVNEGDNIFEIMEAHPNLKYKKLKEKLEAKGLTVQGDTVVRS